MPDQVRYDRFREFMVDSNHFKGGELGGERGQSDGKQRVGMIEVNLKPAIR